jgi:divalent anion:Na+ symporter, DASS family
MSLSRRSLGALLLVLLPPLVGVGFALAGYATAIALFGAILAITVVLWAFSLLDEFVPPLIAVLISLFIGLAPASEALGSFASPTLFTLLGVFALAAAISFSGLGERFGLLLLLKLPNRPFIQQLGFLITGLLLSPFVSSTNSRTALLLPLYESTAKILQLPPRGPANTALMAATIGGASLFSPMLATSKSASIIGLSLLPVQVQDTFLGLFWLQAAAVVVVVLLVCQALLLRQLQAGAPATPLDRRSLAIQLEQMGPINQEQALVLAALATFALGLLTQSWHHIDVAWISGLALILLLVSGVLTKKRFREGLDWPLIFFLIGNGCLVNVMDYVGFSQVLGETANRLLGFTAGSIWLFMAACLVVTVIVRLCLPVNAGMLVAFVMLLPVAMTQGLNPWVCLFLCNVFSDIWFLPYQNSPYIQVLSSCGDQFDQPRFLASKQWLNVAALVGAVLSVPWWSRLGLI